MPRLRKQRRRKVYRHNVNRKRLRNKIANVGSIPCKQIKNAWDSRKSVETNLTEMGLSYDPNKTIKIPSNKKRIISSLAPDKAEPLERPVEASEKSLVAQELETDARAPREMRLKLPNSQVEWLSYLLKKYKNDYRAMARDKKNYNQETWKQIRQKIRRFKTVDGQYGKFLEESGMDAEELEEVQMSDGEL